MKDDPYRDYTIAPAEGSMPWVPRIRGPLWESL